MNFEGINFSYCLLKPRGSGQTAATHYTIIAFWGLTVMLCSLPLTTYSQSRMTPSKEVQMMMAIYKASHDQLEAIIEDKLNSTIRWRNDVIDIPLHYAPLTT